MTSRARTRLIGIAAALAASVCAVITTAPAAQAQPLTPMERCQAGQGPNVDYQMTQYGNAAGLNYPAGDNPPNAIFPGNVVRVVIDESSRVAINWWGESYGVDGHNNPAPQGFPFPGWPKFGAFYRFNNNPTGWVASGHDPNPYNPHPLRELTTCAYAPNVPVRLGLQINDDNIGDNSGAWKYRLRIWY
jgi:hypothetical protein